WHSYAGDERAALEEVVAGWNRRVAAGDADAPGPRIALVSVPHEALSDKLTSAIPNGNGPDLFIYPGHDRIGDWAAGGLIEPAEYFVSEALADRFAYDAIAAMAYQGPLYGLAQAVEPGALDLRTDRLGAPGAARFALVYDNADLYGHAAWLHGCGGRLFDERGRVRIAGPEAVAAARFAAELGGPGGIVPPGMTGQMVSTLFNEGVAAMAIS